MSKCKTALICFMLHTKENAVHEPTAISGKTVTHNKQKSTS